MLELLLELLWSKTLSAPSFGHYLLKKTNWGPLFIQWLDTECSWIFKCFRWIIWSMILLTSLTLILGCLIKLEKPVSTWKICLEVLKLIVGEANCSNLLSLRAYILNNFRLGRQPTISPCFLLSNYDLYLEYEKKKNHILLFIYFLTVSKYSRISY